ncbi:MAG: biotin--[acetyl-CoA-carboxylase] ligase [Proteobacteria bacterium]|nr:biotin--[acetyl-CoA-carboxylase] ligase [Pseudomonadota bacterium]
MQFNSTQEETPSLGHPGSGIGERNFTGLLLANEIREGLHTRVFGKQDVVYFKQTDSTNLRAKELAEGFAPEGTLVVAEKQTSGRGRKGRSWFSPAGDGIYASLILRPAMPANQAPSITLMTAVAVAETLLSLTQLPARIKWPNDILVNGKKIAGILTEISTKMDSIAYVVVGVGMNVNTPPEGFPQELKGKATSILIESGEPFREVDIIRAFLKCYETHYEMLRKSGFKPIIKRWKELTEIIGQRVIVDVIGKQYCGKVIDVDDAGVLIVEDSHGRSHRFYSGDLNLVRNLT